MVWIVPCIVLGGGAHLKSVLYKYSFQCYDEAVIDEMTQEVEMQANPLLVEARKELCGNNTFDPKKSNVLPTLAAEEKWADEMTRTA